MKRTLFYVGVLLLTALILLAGNICFAESGNPTSTMWLYRADTGEWFKAQADELGNLKISTNTIFAVSDTVIQAKLNELLTLFSTGTDTTITRLDTLISGATVFLAVWNGTAYVPFPMESGALGNPKFNLAESTNSVDIAVMSSDAVGPGTFTLGVRSFNYGYDPINNKFVRLRADRILNVQKTISTIHSEVHDGHMYNSSYLWETLADDTTGVFLIDTSTKNVHIVISIATGGNAKVDIWEGATAISSGTGLSEINMNRVSDLTSMANVYHTPESVSAATLLYTAFIGGGAGVGASTTASGGAIRVDTEWIFKKNELYSIVVENESGGATFTSITVEWYEEETD